MAKKREAKSAPRSSKRAKHNAPGAGLWAYPMTALAVSLAGILIAATLIYIQLLGPANTLHAERLHQSHAQMFATYFDARLLALRTSIDRIARAPETVAVLATLDEQRLKEQAASLTREFADAERIELVVAGGYGSS